MIAVIEYESGEIETLVGLQGFGREIAERVLESHDAARLWLLQDDEDPFGAEAEEPYWSLETYWVARRDGEIAKVRVGDWHDGETIWDAMEREYPEAVEMMDECPESDRCVEYRTWDESFWPGDGEGLAAWLAEGGQ
jgi:hypothetical protein